MKVKTARVGGLVESIQGRDKGNFYLIVKIEKDRIHVVDGKKRQLTTPKIKNSKHVQFLPYFFPEIIDRMHKGKNENTQIQIVIQKIQQERKEKKNNFENFIAEEV